MASKREVLEWGLLGESKRVKSVVPDVDHDYDLLNVKIGSALAYGERTVPTPVLEHGAAAERPLPARRPRLGRRRQPHTPRHRDPHSEPTRLNVPPIWLPHLARVLSFLRRHAYREGFDMFGLRDVVRKTNVEPNVLRCLEL